jgi:phage gp36-like protein
VAGPDLKDVSLPVANLLLLEFDSPLAEIATPLESFTVNHGTIEVTALAYSNNSLLALTLDTAVTFGDRIFVSYNPPLDIGLCLRGVLPTGASDVDKKIHSVKQFSRINARNLLSPPTNLDTNLGKDWEGRGYPSSERTSNPKLATVDDFILAYGERETIQLTNLEDGSATSVNVAKLNMALEDANALVDNYIRQANKAKRYLISSNRRRTALMVARYYLDTVRRREDVYRDYQDCIKELEAAKEAERAGVPAIETPRGAIRTHRIPQVYNRQTGKGLSGWQVDPDMRQSDVRNNLFESQNLGEGALDSGLPPSDSGGQQTGLN